MGSNPDGCTLRSRLADHAYEAQYAWFWFETMPTAQRALVRECQEYARLRPQLENKNRPPFCRRMGHEH